MITVAIADVTVMAANLFSTCYKPGAVPSVTHVLKLTNPQNNPMIMCYHYVHWMEKDTEAQKASVACLRSCS